MSFVTSIYHVVISTKMRVRALSPVNMPRLCGYLKGIIQKYNSTVIAINGDANHLHILLRLNPSVALAALVGEMKRASSLWIKHSGLFPAFSYWCDGYFACTVSPSRVDAVVNYIIHQHAHHHSQLFEDEIKRLIEAAGGDFSPDMLN